MPSKTHRFLSTQSPCSGVHGPSTVAEAGPQLFTGGTFDEAGGKPSRNFAIWHMPGKLEARQAGGLVGISWPAAHTNAVLEMSGSAAEPEWKVVEGVPAMLGGQMTITTQPEDSRKFFRLRLENY